MASNRSRANFTSNLPTNTNKGFACSCWGETMLTGTARTGVGRGRVGEAFLEVDHNESRSRVGPGKRHL